MPRDTCRGTKADGSPCGSPVVKGDGYCPAHGPDGSERMAEIGRRGAEATARKLKRPGLDPEALPALRSPQTAEKWLEEIGRAVATGTLGHHEATAAVRAVREWLRAHEAGEVTEEVEELREQLEELVADREPWRGS